MNIRPKKNPKMLNGNSKAVVALEGILAEAIYRAEIIANIIPIKNNSFWSFFMISANNSFVKNVSHNFKYMLIKPWWEGEIIWKTT